ncbi:acyl-CoA thioesterase [Niabella drilacis]|uniref:Acyl-CoA thioesterase FadM n=1 Tax=Niabella drilacis (strain DSM 25811 / CCM 8410 / CCUG 62505 / LMG 26954 / E90) TaxID=1285928 RepID=A0A1G6I3E4_NIADE|nr:thioesterase family protein [Niabella drilacis]SDC00981.1 Acyl-CoA thioesterase FadM [Niabella drilacis]
MPRIRITLPQAFHFSCTIPVRVTDINYGGHVGNDSLLGMIHEARVQFLHRLGYTELLMEGVGLIMADAAIEFKSEAFMGESLIVSVTAGDIHRAGFDLYYLLEKEVAGKKVRVAVAKTGMICFDYALRKIVPLPDAALQKLETVALP